jgi:hypothetical protein
VLLTPEERRELEYSLKLHEEGILSDAEVVASLGRLAHPENLDAILAEIPLALGEPLKTYLFEVNLRKTSYVTSSLPPITSVEAIDLRDLSPNPVDQAMQEASDRPGVKFGDKAGQRVASLWRELPPGPQARCPLQHHGLRFFSEHGLILKASICWQCSNLFGDFRGEDFSYAFDGEASVSNILFTMIRRTLGDDYD